MASTKITRTSAISSEKKLTISTWIKRSYTGEESLIGNTATGSNWAMFYFNGNNNLQFASYINSSYVVRVTTNRKFNDVGAWYHLQATLDVSLGTPEAKIYVNGEEQTDLAYNVQPSQNANTGWFYDWNFEVGVMFGSSYYLNGCLADTYYIQGYVYPPSTFGETDATTGEWKPVLNPTINYGGNGGNSCHLKFENSANMDLDSGDNNLTFTTSGTLTQTQDSPSNVFATLNPLLQSGIGTLTNGNLSHASSSGIKHIASTLGMTSGKFYAEAKYTGGGNYNGVGIITEDAFSTTSNWYSTTNGALLYYTDVYSGGNTYGTFATPSTGDIIGIALDLDNGYMYLSNNGTWGNSGDPTSGSSGTGGIATSLIGTLGTDTFFFASEQDATSGTRGADWNFGNGFYGTTQISSEGTNASGIGKFEYDVPTGYTALSTKGLNE